MNPKIRASIILSVIIQLMGYSVILLTPDHGNDRACILAITHFVTLIALFGINSPSIL